MEKINFPIVQRFYLDNRTDSHAFVESMRKILEVESTAHMFGRTFYFTHEMVQQYQSAKVDIEFEPINHQLLTKEFFSGNLVCIDYLVDIAESSIEANNYFNERNKVVVGKGIIYSSKYYYLEL